MVAFQLVLGDCFPARAIQKWCETCVKMKIFPKEGSENLAFLF